MRSKCLVYPLFVLLVLVAGCLSGCSEELCESRSPGALVKLNEVMVDPQGSDTGQEWLELYNAGAQEVDVSGWEIEWFLSDADSPSGSVVLPEGTRVTAGEFLLVGGPYASPAPDVEVEFDLGNGSGGDGIHLCDECARLIDAVVYSKETDPLDGETPINPHEITDEAGVAATSIALLGDDGDSLARCKDGVDTERSGEDFRATDAPTPRATNGDICPAEVVCPDEADLVVSEVMPDPALTGEPTEYIEIYNAGAAAIPLICVVLYDDGFDVGEGRAVECGGEIGAGAYAVFTKDAADLAQGTGLAEDEICELSMSLHNDGEIWGVGHVTGDKQERLLDAVDCGEMDCPFAEGASMNLDAGALDAAANDEPGSWCTSTTPFDHDGEHAGTPGADNEVCVFVYLEEGAAFITEVMPQPLSPPGAAHGEYIEAFNVSGEDIPLSEVKVREGSSAKNLTCRTGIWPDSTLLVMARDADFEGDDDGVSNGGIDADCEAGFALNDDVESVQLLYIDPDGAEITLDTLAWDTDAEEWPFSEGVSMELVDSAGCWSAADNGDVACWAAAVTPFGTQPDGEEQLGTPGEFYGQ